MSNRLYPCHFDSRPLEHSETFAKPLKACSMQRLLLALVMCPISHAGNMCKEEGTISNVLNNLTITTCDEFNPTGPAINLPADNSTVVYGVLETLAPGDTVLVHLRDRTDTKHDVSSAVVRALLSNFTNANDALEDDKASLLVAITYGNETRTAASVVGVRPVLFMRKCTVVKPYRGMFFNGMIFNHQPSSEGVNSYDSLTLQFSNTVVGDALIGTRVTSLGDYNSNALTWYTSQFGLVGNVTLTWHPGMHGPGDSELVLNTPANMGSGFMDTTFTTPVFSTRTVLEVVQKQAGWVFFVHGNPMYVLQNINGTFSDAAANFTTTSTTTSTTTTTKGGGNVVSSGFIASPKATTFLAVSAIAGLLSSVVFST